MSFDVATVVRSILQQEFGMRPEEVGEDTALLSTGLIDSFSAMALLTAIEAECGLKFRQSDLTAENFETISRIRALIAKRQHG